MAFLIQCSLIQQPQLSEIHFPIGKENSVKIYITHKSSLVLKHKIWPVALEKCIHILTIK